MNIAVVRNFGLVALLFTLAASAAPGTQPGYPQAKRDNALDDYNGVKVADPYRWLEELDSAATRAWVRAEAEITDSYLAKIPVRDGILEEFSG